MISILIPVYNYDIRTLVHDLYQQAEKLNVDYEIIVADDKSESKFRKINKIITGLKNVKYIELDQNIGRSKIRNKLADISSFDFLLFMDCDSKIIKSDFLKKYIEFCLTKDVVVYGGRIYDVKPSDDQLYLHWVFGKEREEIPTEIRSIQPNACFMTNNFLINKALFNKIRFNEFIRRYGHEDTLFGYELKVNNVKIIHIDNPLIHTGLEKCDDFIRKTQAGLNNLKIIVSQNGYLKELINDITVLKYYNILKIFRLRYVFSLIFNGLKPVILKNLCSRNPKLYLFDFFKLGFLTSLMLKK